MKVLIISDTHRSLRNFYEAVDREGRVDQLLHLGDVEGDEEEICAYAGCPAVFVAGNNDFFSRNDRDHELVLQGVRIFMTHGHNYGVSMGTWRLEEEGRSRQADVILFGHTHRPEVCKKNGIILANPGSLSYPRQQGRQPSYAIMEIGQDKKIDISIKFLE